jgi:hypothetical protein
MKTTSLLLSAALLAAVGLLAFPSVQPAAGSPQGDAAAATEDVLHMLDGRVLRGRILAEDASRVDFEYRDPASGITARLSFAKSEVGIIERGVPAAAAPRPGPALKPAPASPPRVKDHEQSLHHRPGEAVYETPARTYGVRRGGASEALPMLYVIPMKGQMGTDIHVDVYREMVSDIRTVAPDYLVLKMHSIDQENRTVNRISTIEWDLTGSPHLDMYRELVHLFHDDLRDVKQALWIEDSLGVSSVIALAWDRLFIRPEGHLGGAGAAAINFVAVKGDANMFGKFREAYMAWLRGFAEYGDLDIRLVDAMVRPGVAMSATWKGREVEWRLDDTGEYLVDAGACKLCSACNGSSPDDCQRWSGTICACNNLTFPAKLAEDLLVVDGVAEDLDDVALLLGLREYRVAKGNAEAIFEQHRQGWRASADACVEWLRDFEQYLGWANGDETLKYLGLAKGRLEKVLAAMQRYGAVELRMLQEFGITPFALQTQIEVLKEQIRALQQGGGRRGGGGGAGRGGGMGGG